MYWPTVVEFEFDAWSLCVIDRDRSFEESSAPNGLRADYRSGCSNRDP